MRGFQSLFPASGLVRSTCFPLLCLGLLALQPGPARAGYWKITQSLTGSCSTSGNSGAGPDGVGFTLQGSSIATNGSVDLSTLATSSSTNGGITNTVQATAGGQSGYGPDNIQGQLLLSGASIIYTLTWVPNNNNLQADPAPSNVTILYRRHAGAYAYAGARMSGSTSSASANVSCGGLTNSASASVTGPKQSQTNSPPANVDPSFTETTLSVSNGQATKTFSLTLTLSVADDSPSGNIGTQQDTSSNSTGSCTVDFCLVSFDLARFRHQPTPPAPPGRPHTPVGGDNKGGGTDPSYTRWLPLAFSPQISSQPFRTQTGALPAPWGNLTCMYSPALQQEPTNPNLDLEGYLLGYAPTPGSDGTFNNGFGPYQTLPGSFTPAYSITDANGERLIFNVGLQGFEDVHSTLVNNGNGIYQLTNAGPPGQMKEAGYYTYTFQKSSSGSLFSAHLISIQDSLGNQQTLTWGVSDPLLTVTDSSSGRSLVLHPNTGGYVGSADAPEIGSGTHTHTTLAWDGSGHATQINVYTGNGQTLLHQDVFAYGGPNGDSITSAQQGVGTAAFNYVADPLMADPFGLSFPRLSSATYGSSTDTSSSDDGGAVAGTYTYTYGPQQAGYGQFGTPANTNTVTDPRGNIFSLQYVPIYPSGALIGLNTTGPAYSGAPANSNMTIAQYQPDSEQPTQVSYYDPMYFQGVTTSPWQADLDGFGDVTLFIDPANDQWSFNYSTDGKLLLSATDPTNVGVTLTYGENGAPANRLTTYTDGAGCATHFTYNTFGQPLSIYRNAGSTASGQTEQTGMTYNATTGDLTTFTAPSSDQMTVTGYDALGDPLGTTLYPDTGNPATSTKPLTTSISYDASQNPTQITNPAGTSLVTTFTNGVITGFQTINQGQTLAQMTLSRDSRGRVYAASDPVGTLVQYKFDRNSNRTRVIDGNNNTTRLTYGPNNEFTGYVWPDNSTGTTVSYDAAGRVSQTFDERGVNTVFLYDFANRLTDIQFPAYPAQNVHYTLDAAGRLLTASDSTGSRAYSYDPNNKRLLSVTTVYTGLPSGHNTFVVSYTYYPDGKAETMTSPAGTTTYQFDVDGRLSSLTAADNSVVSWTYDHMGRTTAENITTTGGKALSTSYVWGVSGLGGDPSTSPYYLRQIKQKIGTSTYWTYTLQHSYLGQLLQEQGKGSGTYRSDTELFSYDARGRLASESDSLQLSQSSSYSSSGTYNYDLANNVKPSGSPTWSYNSDDQVSSAPYVAGSPALPGASGLSHDASGNTATINGSTLTWDCWGNLSGINGLASYTYDSAGRRVSKTTGGATTYYLYNGPLLLAEIDSSGNLLRSYTWGALGVVGDISGAQSHYYFGDEQGSVRAVLNANGSVAWEGAYTAFGSTNSGGYPSTPFGWKGRGGAYRDSESSLVLMGVRYYAANIGRFLSRDPAGFRCGPNLYVYCANDPLDFFDPTGKSLQDVQNWYDNGMGGFSQWVDQHLLGGATANFGRMAGLYDGGKVSRWQVAGAGTQWGLGVGGLALGGFGLGKAAVSLGSAGLGALGAGAAADAADTAAADAAGDTLPSCRDVAQDLMQQLGDGSSEIKIQANPYDPDVSQFFSQGEGYTPGIINTPESGEFFDHYAVQQNGLVYDPAHGINGVPWEEYWPRVWGNQPNLVPHTNLP